MGGNVPAACVPRLGMAAMADLVWEIREAEPDQCKMTLRGVKWVCLAREEKRPMPMVGPFQFHVLPPISPAHDVVHGAGILNAQLARHWRTLPGLERLVKRNDRCYGRPLSRPRHLILEDASHRILPHHLIEQWFNLDARIKLIRLPHYRRSPCELLLLREASLNFSTRGSISNRLCTTLSARRGASLSGWRPSMSFSKSHRYQ